MKKILLSFFSLLCFFQGHTQSVVTTYAGNGTFGFVNGDTAMARFKSPFGICMNKNGDLFIADGGNNCIRKITATGSVSTLAGTGLAGFADGPALSSQFNNPTGVCVDDSGNVYVSDFQNHMIRKISFTGTVTTIAGSGVAGYADGIGAAAQFNYPRGICRDRKGNLYVGDSWNHRIRKIATTGSVSTYAGGGSAMGVSSIGSLLNGQDTAARFYTPAGVSVDKIGNIYVADAYNHRIRKIDTNRVVSVIAGSGAIGVGNGGYSNGPISTASLNTPTELFSDSAATKIYIGDTFNNRVRLVTTGSLTLLAGKGIAGYVNGIDTSARFNYARGVVANSNGSKVFVVDYNNHCVRKITAGSLTSVIDQRDPNADLVIFPNPTKDSFNIKELPFGKYELQITDLTGKILLHNSLILPSKIDVSSLSKGIYLISVEGENVIKHNKIIID